VSSRKLDARSLVPALTLALALALGAATPAPGMPVAGRDGARPDARDTLSVADTSAAADTSAVGAVASDSAAPPLVVSEAVPAAPAAPAAVAPAAAAPAATVPAAVPAAPNVAPNVAPTVAPRTAPAARILRRPAPNRNARVRLELSLAGRTLVALQGGDTLLVAPAGIGTGETLRFGARRWRFDTPAGRRVVLGKQEAPVWVPPDWHYAELAARRGYRLVHLSADRAVPLGRGRRLVVRRGRVGVAAPGGAFAALPADEEIVFGRTLYVPPYGTANRRIPGQLGAYRLDLGDGYLIHGTPNEGTVGTPSSHGCVRLAGDALAWVYRHVPVGAAVLIR
jgi:lipoprotein-anchoring transpeptidase ErfK/SrfK